MNEMFKFHNPFAKEHCHQCGETYDPARLRCPNCGDIKDPKRALGPIAPDEFVVSPARQIILFLILYVGLTVVGTIFSAFISSTSLDTVTKNTLINYLAYGVLLVAVIFVLFPELKDLFRSFWNPKIFYGLLGLAAIFVLNYLYNLAISGIEHSTNANESSLQQIIPAYPIASFFVIGLIGPFLEECGYRIGLFGFFKRINIILAYVVASVIFGLIHIHDWTSLNEWLSYPPYVISGFVMALLYDKVGFSASFLCHSVNNIISIISILLTSGAAS